MIGIIVLLAIVFIIIGLGAVKFLKIIALLLALIGFCFLLRLLKILVDVLLTVIGISAIVEAKVYKIEVGGIFYEYQYGNYHSDFQIRDLLNKPKGLIKLAFFKKNPGKPHVFYSNSEIVMVLLKAIILFAASFVFYTYAVGGTIGFISFVYVALAKFVENFKYQKIALYISVIFIVVGIIGEFRSMYHKMTKIKVNPIVADEVVEKYWEEGFVTYTLKRGQTLFLYNYDINGVTYTSVSTKFLNGLNAYADKKHPEIIVDGDTSRTSYLYAILFGAIYILWTAGIFENLWNKIKGI